MTVDLGTVPAGSKLVATGKFTGGQRDEILWQAPDGSCVLWLMSNSDVPEAVPVSLPAGYTVVGAEDGGIPNQGANTVLDPGTSELLLEDAAGNLAYGSFHNSLTGSGFTVTAIGTIGPGRSVEAVANYNIANYFGGGQVLLGSTQDNALTAFDSNLPAFTIPNGFTIVPDGSGNYFGSDLPETLLSNAAGTVEAILEGGTVVTAGQTNTIVQSAVLGTLQPNQSIVAVSTLNGDGSTDIILQQSSILTEWVIRQGAIAQTVTLGLPAGFTVAGVGDFDSAGTASVVVTNGAGDVEMIAAAPADPASDAVLSTQTPTIVLDGNYDVLSTGGINATLSDYLAELTSGIPLSATGTRILTIQQGALSNCSYEQVHAGNITFAAWEQNVATLNAIAAYCRANGITVQVETQLGSEGNVGAAQTYQWLNPALAAGLPIGYVEDNQEFMGWTTLNVATMAAHELQDIQIIHAALPNAVFGEWEIPGSADSAGTITPYHAFLQNWYTTLNAGAAQQGLPGISYIIADQYFGPNPTGGPTAGESAQQANADTPANDVASLIRDAGADGVKVEIQDSASDTDLNPLQALARQEMEISQEATLGIAAIQLSGGFSQLPVSDAVNVPGATYNGAAEAAAITPLYQSRSITTAGAVALTLPLQAVVGQGILSAIHGVSISAGAADQANRLAVVLIDQTGSLGATPSGSATVSHDGANTLILNGTPADVAAELASLTIDETVAGPDSIDVEAFGNTGRVAGGTIDVLATSANGSLTFTPSTAGVLPQLWDSASAIINNGAITGERFIWNVDDGLDAGAFIGGTTIEPVTAILIDQPLLQGPLASAAGIGFPAADLAGRPANPWKIYGPLDGATAGTLAAEGVPVDIEASALTFDALTGRRQTEVDTLAPVPPATYAGLPQFADPATPYYFADGGIAVTQYNTGDNVDWPTATGLYADGAGAISVISKGPPLVIADGSTNTMVIGSIQTLYGIVNGATRIVEVRYLGGASDPYDEVDQIFNPYSAAPQLWQQINTVDVPAAMGAASPLPVPSATTVTEYNTGNNPNWSNSVWINTGQAVVATSAAGDQAEAVTYENGNWDSEATIAANGVAGVSRGVTWIGEGAILSAYTLAAPNVQGWTGAAIIGTGIAGDWVVVTGSDGAVVGGAQIGAGGAWRITPSGVFDHPSVYYVTAQQFDLAGDSSAPSVSYHLTYLNGPASEFIIADNNGSLYIQDTGSAGYLTQTLPGANEMVFTSGIGIFDPTGTAEDVARIYGATLGRAPDVAGLEYWAAQVDGSNVPLSAVAATFTTSPEFIQNYGSLSDAAFVNQLYLNVLGRPADAAGAQYWDGVVASSGSRGTVVLAFAECQENEANTIATGGDENNAEAYRLYQAALNRPPDASGLLYWSSALTNGVPPTQIAQDFIDSAEFQQDYGALTGGAFVSTLYLNVLHRAADPTGLQYWTNALQKGQSEASVLASFSDCLENRTQTASATHANWVFIPA
jgi:hypothetical protein